MKPAALLAELRSRGIKLSLSGEDLVYRAPKGSITSELLSTLKSQKTSIIDELKVEHSLRDTNNEFENLTRILELEDSVDQTDRHPYARYVEPVKARLLNRVGLDINYERAEGCFLFDEQGKQYLDCIAQYGGLPFGYNPPEIWSAINHTRDQNLPNVATQSMLDSAGQLANQLLNILPHDFEQVIFTNSGAESTEVAIKLCRASKNRPGIISTRNGFHGLTTGSLSVTGGEAFQNGFFVRGNDFHHVPYGDADALEEVIKKHPDHFAAFVVEPIQGEAGIVCPPQGYLQRVREVCDRHNVLLVFDEVQTGLGRTGDLFAFEFEEVIPDVLTIAKALGGGLMPCGAVICGAHVYSTHFGLRHSSTFAGNALASQCGIATIETLLADSRKILNDVKETGTYLKNQLVRLKQEFPNLVSDVRGRGFMQAIEFDFESLQLREGLMPILADEGILLHLVISYMLHQHGIRVAPTFMGRNIIRLEPPLIFKTQHCEQLVAALRSALTKLDQGTVAAFVCHMIQLPEPRRNSIASRSCRNVVIREATNDTAKHVNEFGFLVHLRDLDDLVDFEPTLDAFTSDELSDLKHQLTRSSEPTVIGTTDIMSTDGRIARGHFVLVPYTPDELVGMPVERAIEQINKAAFAAAQENVRLIGLGGFTSILTLGGVALDCDQLPPLTSGNSLTAAATIDAVEMVCKQRGLKLEDCEVAVVGAAGQIGRVVSSLLADLARELVLVGRDGSDQRTRQKLSEVADQLNARASIVIAEDINRISSSDIVVLASSATEPFISSQHIKPDAIVIDASRPPNVSENVIVARPDVTWIEGGLIQFPHNSELDLFAGPHQETAYACVAETALWALSPELGEPSAKRILNVETVHKLRMAARKAGFTVAVQPR